jgi:hypothetical protein
VEKATGSIESDVPLVPAFGSLNVVNLLPRSAKAYPDTVAGSVGTDDDSLFVDGCDTRALSAGGSGERSFMAVHGEFMS